MDLETAPALDNSVDRDDLAYWFPRLERSGLKVPKTEIIAFEGDLVPAVDGQEVEGFRDLVEQVQAAALRVGGYPAFLRTGHGSGKHEWRSTCYLRGPQDVRSHILNLVEWSVVVDFMGLPTNTWAVREFLDLRKSFEAFRGMPVAREFRCFFRDGQVQCLHSYWPKASLIEGGANSEGWQEAWAKMNTLGEGEEELLRELASKAAAQFDGFWSLDLAQLAESEGASSWVAIDMAEGDNSYHWKGCEHDPHPERHQEEEEGPERDWSQMLVLDAAEGNPVRGQGLAP